MLFRFNLLFLLSIQPLSLMGDVSRFLDPIRIKPSQVQPSFTINQKTTALIAPLYSEGRTFPEFSSSDREVKEVFLTREMLEFKLGELLGYRYQASGKVVAYVTRQWTPIRLSSNFILKIRDCMPDNLSPSTFVRFTIWDHGSNIGEFAE